MKKLVFISIYLLASVVFLSSCKKDDERPANHFSYNGTSYKLSHGYIQDYGENGNNSYDFDVCLASSTIQYSPSDEDFKGVGNILYIDLNTSSANGLVDGTYNYASDRSAFVFIGGVVGMNVDASSENGNNALEIVGGTVKISTDENITTFEFDLMTTGNKKITGTYTGTLSLL